MAFPDRITFRLRAGDLEDRVYDLVKSVKDMIPGETTTVEKTVTVTVASGTSQGSSVADATITGGAIVGCYPVSLTDNNLKSLVLNDNGSITATLIANATGTNTYAVRVKK